jgi:hypothetical protein
VQGSSIALMMEAARTSEASVDIYLTTRQYIPEDSELYTCHHENLKSHVAALIYGEHYSRMEVEKKV